RRLTSRSAYFQSNPAPPGATPAREAKSTKRTQLMSGNGWSPVGQGRSGAPADLRSGPGGAPVESLRVPGDPRLAGAPSRIVKTNPAAIWRKSSEYDSRA